MRKILSILLAVLLLTTLVACGGGEPTSSTPISSESSTPESSTPESSAPEASEPETSEPDVSEPETSDTTEGDQTTTTKKDDGKTTTTKKDDGKTTTTKKDDGKTTTTKKDDGKTTTTKKDDGKTTTTKKDNGKTTTTTKKTTTTTKKTTTTTKKTTTTIVAQVEKPYTGNAAVLYNKQSSSYDATAEAKRQSILNSADATLKPSGSGKTYYISYKGNDNNNGTSKSTAWKTTENLGGGYGVEVGSVILFERGGVYRNVSITLRDGVSVGAYGSGPKPQLLAGDKNYADQSLWTNTDTNIWRTEVKNADPLYGENEDVGNIIFDHGKINASTGKELSLKKLDKDYEFYYDTDDNYVYLYLSKGNPAKVHANIEMAPNKHIIHIRNDNHIVENVCLKYTGGHGISAAGSSNITVRNCEIGYIGGGILSKPAERYGNGVEFFGSSSNCLTENNWIYQCYDAGYTNQAQASNGPQTNFIVRGNLIEYCLYNIELWATPIKNSTYENNILRFAGYGFGSLNRMGSSTVWASHITFNNNNTPTDNVVIKNNIMDTSYVSLVYIIHPNDTSYKCAPTITNNTWIQKKGGIIATLENKNFNGKLYANSQSEMETNVKKYDLNPTKITLDN